MKYTSTLLAVTDMEKSKQFYHDVLGLDIVADFAQMSHLLAALCCRPWYLEILYQNRQSHPAKQCRRAIFEEDNIDAFCNHLKSILKSAMFMNCLNIVGGTSHSVL